ncbi:MAG: SMODS domain-containing nucleotidyltransferase [Actinomycetota bacterium]
MATTTAKAFDEFRDRISLTDSQKKKARERADRTASFLKDAFPASSTTPVRSTKPMGSVSRGTAVRPLDDIDVLSIFNNKDNVFDKYRQDSQAFLYHIRKGVDAKTRVRKIGARGQAVRLFYKDGLHVDIAPVFEWNSGGYALPAGDGSWLTTDPPEQKKWINQREADLGHLKKRVKFLKKWNAAHSKRLGSWHLEVMIARVFTSMSGDSRNGLMKFFEWAPGYLSVQDPDGYGGDLSDYLTWAARQDVLSSLEAAHERAAKAKQAEAAGDHREAIRLWTIVLGDDFPAYTGS